MNVPFREGYVFSDALEWENVGTGVRRRILGYDDALMMVCVRFDRDAVGYVHQHPHRQVTYVASGKFRVTIGDQKKVQKAGDCFFIPPDVPHGVEALEEGDLVDIFAPAREDFVAPPK
jgi:quercetin dioxygenase-like cupin family protein